MREILFRGQTRKNGEKVEMATGEKVPGHWVYGGIFPGTGDYSIIYGGETENDLEWHVVYSETVGQYTGLKDKNGKMIFDGDILLLDDIKGIVNYGTGCFCVNLSGQDYLYRSNPAIDIVLNGYPGLEIIGNIHDNPEMLKGGEG